MSVRSQACFRRMVSLGVASVMLCGASLSDLKADASNHNWPHLRGPHYNSHSDEAGLLESWPADGPPVLWATELGQGYSGFCCVENRIYTQMQTVTGQYVVCLDADSGETLWEHRYGLPYEALSIYPGPRSTPTWSDGRLYFASPMGLIACLNAQSGKPIWSINVKEKYDGKGTGFGYASCPLIEAGMVILPVGGKGASVVALDADDGSTVWKSGDAHSSYCSALPITLDNEHLVIAFLENSFACFELDTGRLLWSETYSQGYDEHSAMPLYAEPNLVLSFPFKGGSTMYRLERKQTAGGRPQEWTVEGKEIWQSRELSNDVASSVLVDGYIYGFDLRDAQSRANRPSRGKFKCLKLETGDVLWETDATGHASVIAADGKLILFNDRGEVILIRARPDQYEELARADVLGGDMAWTAPSLHGGRLYIRNQSQVACLYLGEPKDLAPEQREAARPASQVASMGPKDVTWLLAGEREHPFVRPDFHELSLWFWWCVLGVYAPAMVLTVPATLSGGREHPERRLRRGVAVFLGATFQGQRAL